jgi:hypothetical protein
MAQFLETVLLVTVIWLPDISFISTKFPLYRIVAVLLLTLALSAIAQHSSKPLPLGPQTRKIILAAGMMLGYMLLIDLLRNAPTQGILDALKGMLVVLLLPTLEILRVTGQNKFDKVLVLSILPMAFGAAQIFDPNFTIVSLWPANNLILLGAPSEAGVYVERTGRVMGLAVSTAGLFMGMACVIAFIKWIEDRRLYAFLILITGNVFLFFTATRSALFGTIPSIVLAYLIVKRKQLRSVVMPFLIALTFLAALYLTVSLFELGHSRLSHVDDVNTRGKLLANYYAGRYALQENPLAGIPKEDIYLAISTMYYTEPAYWGYRLPLASVTTSHNQFVWMFKFYGLVGLALLLYFHVLVFQKIMIKQSQTHKLVLLGLLIYITQYSFLHNVFLWLYPLFWILLAVDLPVPAPGRQRYDEQRPEI